MTVELVRNRGIMPPMNVIDRLQRLTGEQQANKASSSTGDGPRAEEIRALRARIETILSRRPEGRRAEAPGTARGNAVPLESLVAGTEMSNAAGSFFCAHQVAKGSSQHGERCIRDLTPLDMGLLAVLANEPALRACEYREALFLDTETTGLAGGAGTVPFLVGLGWFEGEAFVTQQLFARDYAEEAAALLCLTESLQGKRFLVSFNGKAFDANLLASRFIMNRLPDPLRGLPHCDLLHPARRLLSHRLADRRLGALETAVLGFEREGDIPGSEIPQRYFDWLRRRDGRLMADIFLHNRLDILSLAALAAHLVGLIDSDGETARHPPGDRLAAARLFLARSCPQEAIRLLGPLAACGLPETAQAACRELSLLHKGAGEWTEAAALWEEMVRRNGENVFALTELAKWCEHRRHDCRRALELTGQALGSPDLKPEERAGLVARRERLERKLATPVRKKTKPAPKPPL
ncbi:MAG: ribonuclease H-like domain-containing protein [Deltaproteobacteria bacterium]|nr:ribonuclease H-like domain-containing protein [Deltaproteobacteria bacterium]